MITNGTGYVFASDEPRLFVQALSYRAPRDREQATADGRPLSKGSASGSGSSPEEAFVPAVAEILERHAASCIEASRLFSASANELGGYALDLRTLPACSRRELKNSKCYVQPARRDQAMRWVEGISLMTGKPCALPFAMVYLYSGNLHPQEKLQAPISTGLAAHCSLPEALLAGLLEVIERDSLSIMWLQMIPGRQLERYDTQKHTPVWAQSASARLNYLFRDISTDLEVPVVCCIRIAPDNQRAHTLISCAAGFDRDRLIEKTVRDIGAHSIGFRKERPVPIAFEDFTAIHHGATYMAHKERASAFNFLLQGDRGRSDEGGLWCLQQNDQQMRLPEQQLEYVLRRLRALGFEAYGVDLTTVEAFSVGMRVVRVIVPGLQPLPYRYATRYLAHSRLYDAPRSMENRVLAEKNINPWPLPFA
jgi:ribosomal protein S12 methylthiotransferase accessory factor